MAPINKTPSAGRRYATLRETAAYIGCGERTVRIMVEDGRLRAYKMPPGRIVRIDLNEVDATMGGEVSA